MKRAVSLLVIFLFCTVIWAQNRHALVIGNANYQDSALPKLPNTINDAQDISEALDKLGYKVVLKNDLNQIAMTREITDFIARLRAGGQRSEGFFWFGGHGIMLDGINYLLPVTANTERDDVVIATSYSFNRLLDQLSNLRNKANVLVLDACRTPPPTAETTRDAYSEITRRVQRVSNVPSDLFIMYSTKAGSVAYEGAGKRNSPFTEAFLNNIMSAEPLVLMVSDIVKDTITKTEGRQQPDYQGSIPNDKYYSLNTAGVVTPTNDIPTSNILTLSGQVYDEQKYPLYDYNGNYIETKIEYIKYNGSLTVLDDDNGGIGKIENGQFSYSIGVPRKLVPISSISLGTTVDYISDKNVKICFPYPRKGGWGFEVIGGDRDGFMLTFDCDFLYVDKDVIISGKGYTVEEAFKDIHESFNLSLKKGWNIIITEYKNTIYDETTVKIYLSSPSYKPFWTLTYFK